MQTWFSQSLGDGVFAFESKEKLCQQFMQMFAQTSHPKNAAVFTRHELEGRLQCEVIAYFSPAAAALARQVGAKPCDRPSPHDLDLLAGEPSCKVALFPEAP